ncbi:MAG TPA: amino acid adenylation domain-containing protein [Pseudonocardiaceae bacterium]
MSDQAGWFDDVATNGAGFDEALDALLAMEGSGAAGTGDAVPLRARGTTSAPLSFAQRQVWFFEQWLPGTPTYNVGSAFRVDGPVDTAALERAIAHVVSRHEVLRSRFGSRDGEPVQVVLADAHVPVAHREVAGDDEALAHAEAEVRTPFALGEGPVIRVLVLSTAPDRHLLVITVHHIAFDGWSMDLLLAELDEAYRAVREGREPATRRPAVQYRDVAAWERDRWDAGELAGQAAYWRERLAGAPAVLDLPVDRPRPATRAFTGRTHTFTVPAHTADAVRELARERGTTPFLVLLAAFGTLLARYGGQEDVVIGTPVATRGRTELEPLIGLLVNTVALRTDLSGNPSFAELLDRVRATAAEAYDNAELPFERLVDELGIERDLSHSPVTQVVFGLREERAVAHRLGAARLTPVYVERGTAKFDLTWSVRAGEDDPAMHVEVEYDTGLFDPATVARMAEHYGRLLHGLVRDPGARIGEVDLLSDADRRILTPTWHAEEHPGEPAIHEQVAAWAARTPDAVALTCEGTHLTYAELDRRANGLAHELRAAGVRDEAIVGVCAERGPELVIALLAVLKAGGAYLPVDPVYPAERLRFLLSDAGAAVVVAQDAARVPDGPWTVLGTDAAEAAAPPAGEVPAGRLAYVIYTSGSTGTPKGVGVPHRNVARLLSATDGWFGFGREDVWTLFHSYAFDFSVWEVWGALCTGGRLVVVPHAVSRAPADFRALLAAEGVTVLNQTPSAFRHLEEADAAAGDAEPLRLRVVVFGGEALDLPSVARWFARHGDTAPRLVNMYGITETTVHVTYRPLLAGDVAGEAGPIGVPIRDLQVYVLDRWGSIAPVGVPGELYVGGAGLARGYLGRPGLTAERFVPDPFGGRGGRLYRTGDVGRYTVHGELEYLGRNDDQVKVRGFRIELGEIETVLGGHPLVRAAAVAARRDGGRSARLVAYVVADGALAVDELRGWLAERLPDYMVPGVVVFLDELPVTANGKVDRRALPEPQRHRPELAGGLVEPRTPVERRLAEVWAEVLDVDRVGVHDSFFDLGGDSIRSLQVLGLAKSRGLEFTLRDLFRTPTIAELAGGTREVAVTATVREPFSLVSERDRAALPEGLVDAYPMSVLQAGMVFHMRLDPENLPYHNVNSFHLRAPYDAALFDRAVHDVVERHPILRTEFDLTRYSEPMQLVRPTATLPVEHHDLRHLSEAEQERALLDVLHAERHRPFELDDPPFLRYLLHRRTDATFQWTVTEHHAIFDGWSLFSTQAEVLRRYLRLLDDPSAAPEPPPTSQFRDFIELERRAISSDEDKQYWHDTLAGYTPVTLPTWPGTGTDLASAEDYDSAVGGETEGDVRQWRFTSTRTATHRSLEALVPVELCDALVTLAAKSGTPFKSVLLAAHLKVMSLLTGDTDVVTGLTAHGRPEDVDATEVRGMFLNVPPIRVDVAGGTWSDLVRRVFRAEEDLLPYRRYPLARLQWDLGGGQLFDNTFLYNHFHVMQDVIGGDVEILDNRIESTTEYRAEPTNYSLSTGFLRNPRSSQLLLRLDYYTEKLSDAQAEAIRAYYLAVLNAMVAGEDRHDEFSPLGTAERRRMLVDWNGPARDYPVDRTVHELIAEQAARTPDALAVQDDHVRLTYAELDARANRLARHLRALGAGPERVVGVCVERDAELVVTLLGVLRSGAAYLPLDPSYPADRLRFLLTDAGAELVLTRAALAGRVPAGDWAVVATDEPATAAAVAALPAHDLGRTSTPANLAYVIYTSGSTGRPKGVQVPHSGLVNYLCWAREGYAARGDGGAPVFSSFAFDMIVPNLYTPLIMGQRVCVLPESLDLTGLARRLAELAPFSFIKLTPGHLDVLSQVLGPRQASSLAGTLAVGADAFPGRNLAAWRRLDTTTPVLNEYGPTEASVGNTVYDTGDAPIPADRDLLPIGRAIPNTTMYVLDAALNPAPVGVPGELYIGGDCVVRGYAGRPGLTAERFLPDPFAAGDGARMYRTGDLGRWLPDGRLDFLGRVDEQVKVNGYRVELGEIEMTLAEHPAVTAAVAAVVGADRATQRLVAYYVPNGDAGPGELLDHLARRLPAYLVPGTVVPIDAVPLNANGKVDRKQLPDPRGDRSARRAATPPRTPMEQLLAAAWRDMLGLTEVDVHDGFTALGGNSLTATQLAFRLGDELGIDLSLATVLGARSLAELAARTVDAVREAHGDEVADVLGTPNGGGDE